MVKQMIKPSDKGTKKRGILRPLALSLCMLTFAGAAAQTEKVSLEMKNASVKELFTAIEKQTPWRFSYRDVEVEQKERVTLSVQSVELKTVLTRELKKRGLTYRLSGNKIIITAVTTKQFGEKGEVKGRIKDEKGEPVIGATIMLTSDRSIGTVTDYEGNFTLPDVSEGDNF